MAGGHAGLRRPRVCGWMWEELATQGRSDRLREYLRLSQNYGLSGP